MIFPVRPRSCWLTLAVLAAHFLSPASVPANQSHPSWHARPWQSDDGLPNNNVSAVAQTQDGYLWVATSGRLARFDGDRFEEFHPSQFAEADARVTIIAAGRDGSLWVPIDRGPIVRLHRGRAEFFTNTIPNLLADSAVEDAEGALWVSYRGGNVYRVKDGHVSAFNQTGFPTGNGGYTLTADRHGRVWLAQNGKVRLLRNDRVEFIKDFPSPATRVIGASDGGAWICTRGELHKYSSNGSIKQVGHLNPGQSGLTPTILLEDQNGAVWIGTSASGLFRYDGTRIESIPTSHRGILSLVEDREGNLWVGTAGGGLNRIQPRGIELHGPASGLPFEAVQTVNEDIHGTIWAATQNGAVACWTNGVWQTVSTNANWPGGVITCIAPDQHGGLWLGGRGRLYYWRDGKFRNWGSADGLPNFPVHALLASRQGDVWIGGNFLGCIREGKLTPIPLPRRIQMIRAIAEDSAGHIWLGTARGELLRVTNGTITDETALMGGVDSIRCLTAGPDGSLWIGFATGGLGRLKEGKFSRVRAAQGLGDDSISQVMPDDQGWIWLGADHGLFKVRQQELESLFAGSISRVQSIRYGRDEGLPNLQANFGDSPGTLRSRDQRIWLPTRSGLAVIHPTRLKHDLNPPPVLIKRVALNDRAIAAYGGVMPTGDALNLRDQKTAFRVPPGHHRIEFDFTALNFSTPENLQFRYRLSGVDGDWIDAKKQRNAVYSRLASGQYRFEVTARKTGGTWNQNSAAFEFAVAPFFWETWWFRLGTMALFTGAVIAVGRYVSFRRLRLKLRTLEQQAALDKERSRIAKDIHDDLGGSLTQAALLLDLAQQDREQPDKVAAHVKQVASAVRQITESLDEIVWAANPRNDTLPDLVDYISLFAVEFLKTAGVRCRIDRPTELPFRPVSPEVRHSLFLVIKEALNNVVRHAQAGEVRLRMEPTDKSLRVTIEDDGRGFDGEPRGPGAEGLWNMRHRMAEIGGHFEMESKPGEGTRVTLAYVWPDRS